MVEEMSLRAREALVAEKVWTETGWPVSLAEVLEDVGEGAAGLVPSLAVWCKDKKDPAEEARRLARIAVWSAEDPVQTLTAYVRALG